MQSVDTLKRGKVCSWRCGLERSYLLQLGLARSTRSIHRNGALAHAQSVSMRVPTIPLHLGWQSVFLLQEPTHSDLWRCDVVRQRGEGWHRPSLPRERRSSGGQGQFPGSTREGRRNSIINGTILERPRSEEFPPVRRTQSEEKEGSHRQTSGKRPGGMQHLTFERTSRSSGARVGGGPWPGWTPTLGTCGKTRLRAMLSGRTEQMIRFPSQGSLGSDPTPSWPTGEPTRVDASRAAPQPSWNRFPLPHRLPSPSDGKPASSTGGGAATLSFLGRRAWSISPSPLPRHRRRPGRDADRRPSFQCPSSGDGDGWFVCRAAARSRPVRDRHVLGSNGIHAGVGSFPLPLYHGISRTPRPCSCDGVRDHCPTSRS